MSLTSIHLQLSSCRLRPWQPEDAGSLAKHADNPRIAERLRDGFPHPYTFDDAVKWIQSMRAQDQQIVAAIEIGGEAVGGVGIIPLTDVYRLTAEIGYWLSESHWNKGILTEIIPELANAVFSGTEIVRIQARVFEGNAASMRVLEKSGFRLEAVHRKAVIKSGKILDEYMWARVKESAENE